MRSQKTETLTVRLAPDIKATLRQAADREHRSLANMLEVMIRDWWEARKNAPIQRAQHESTKKGIPKADG
jgi:hypothetical protein